MFADREILLAEARRRSQPGFTVSDEYLGYEPYTIYIRRGRLDDLSFRVNAAMVEIYESPVIHRLLTDNFPYRLADTVGHLIILQRLPKGDIYKP